MKPGTAILTCTAGLGCLLLSSCFIVRVPLNVTSAVVVGTAKVGSKAASATANAFTKSDEEKAEEEKKKKLKEAEEKKKVDATKLQEQQQQQPLLPESSPPPPTGKDGHYKPSITPDMLKNGGWEKEVTPSPIPPGY